MKTTSVIIAGLLCAGLYQGTLLAADETSPTPGKAERIGVYDSRAIAYAHFWSEAQQRKLKDLVRAAQEAKAAGQTERAKELEAQLRQGQERIHLQLFSTAPVDDALAGLKDHLPAIQKEAGVSRLISKWDEAALKQYPHAERVDVTHLLLREFKLDEKQQKMVAEMQKKQPLPLKEAEKLMREGKL